MIKKQYVIWGIALVVAIIVWFCVIQKLEENRLPEDGQTKEPIKLDDIHD